MSEECFDAAEDAWKNCAVCKEEWPATNEYFFTSQKSKYGLFFCCKACYSETRSRNARENRPLHRLGAELETVIRQWFAIGVNSQ